MRLKPLQKMTQWTGPGSGLFWRLICTGLLPSKAFVDMPANPQTFLTQKDSLHLEVVTHCWHYAHMLVYQLSSIALHPPTQGLLTMTVYYNNDDIHTKELLDHFAELTIPNVRWNWKHLPKNALMRRAIGRNQSALKTRADWVWFTDCDLVFHSACLDGAMQALKHATEPLVYPSTEWVTPLLDDNHPYICKDTYTPRIAHINTNDFLPTHPTRATGPLQILNGHVARTMGYCNALKYYQQPSERWRKTYEDRAFRWLINTQGIPVEIPSVYRIRHSSKGRYSGPIFLTMLRKYTRKHHERSR